MKWIETRGLVHERKSVLVPASQCQDEAQPHDAICIIRVEFETSTVVLFGRVEIPPIEPDDGQCSVKVTFVRIVLEEMRRSFEGPVDDISRRRRGTLKCEGG